MHAPYVVYDSRYCLMQCAWSVKLQPTLPHGAQSEQEERQSPALNEFKIQLFENRAKHC